MFGRLPCEAEELVYQVGQETEAPKGTAAGGAATGDCPERRYRSLVPVGRLAAGVGEDGLHPALTLRVPLSFHHLP